MKLESFLAGHLEHQQQHQKLKQDIYRWIVDYVLKSKLSTEQLDGEFARQILNDRWHESIAKSGITLLASSLIDLLPDVTLQNDFIGRIQYLFAKFFSKCSASDSSLAEQLSQMLEPIFSLPDESHRHRNVCLVLRMILDEYSFSENKENRERANQLIDYIVRNAIESARNEETKLWALLVLERILLDGSTCLVGDRKSKLIQILQNLSAKFETLQRELDHKPGGVYINYQVAFLAKWLLENVSSHIEDDLNSGAADSHENLAKMLRVAEPRFEARSDSADLFVPVRSAFESAPTGAIYYYEVQLLTSGAARIGWASSECVFERHDAECVGDTDRSIGFDGHSIWCGKKRFDANRNGAQSGEHYEWQAGDIVGSLLHLDSGRLEFYLNGTPILYAKKLRKKFFKIKSAAEESPEPTFFACASLGSYCHLRFNFGNRPFAFAPSSIIAEDGFQNIAKMDFYRYRLLETSLAGGSYWFKIDPNPNSIPAAIFADTRQIAINRWLNELETRVAEDDFDHEFLYGEHKWQFESLVRQDFGYLRLIQAIICQLGRVFSADEDAKKIDVVVSWIMYYLSTLDDDKCSADSVVGGIPEKSEKICFFDRTEIDASSGTTTSSLNLPAPAKLLQLIYPYTQLPANTSQNQRLLRNATIAFSIVTRKYWFLLADDFFGDEILRFVARALVQTNDLSTSLFASLCLDDNRLIRDDSPPRRHRLIDIIANRLAILAQCDMLAETNLNFDSADFVHKYRVAFCARWCLQNNRSLCRRSNDSMVIMQKLDLNRLQNQNQNHKAILHLPSRTEYMKLSADLWCARSDAGSQSIRCAFAVTGGEDAFYYEAIAITAGPMRIGWTAGTVRIDGDNQKEVEFWQKSSSPSNQQPQNQIGDCEQSIGIDRYQRCIWHDADRYQIRPLPAWKPGDVIGALIDLRNRKFVFTLNGKPILVRRKHRFRTFHFENVNSTNIGYFAAVTLWPHQQCYLNFGQMPFRYPPNDFVFHDFRSRSRLRSSSSAAIVRPRDDSYLSSPSLSQCGKPKVGKRRYTIWNMFPRNKFSHSTRQTEETMIK